MPKGTPVADGDYAPYAAFKNINDVIVRYRNRDLPNPLTASELERLGVSSGMTARTLRALRFLGLTDEGGYRQEPFERLKKVTTEEYPQQLAEIVRAAYLPIFQIVDPAADSDTALADAFRRYEPSAQRERMIALFRGLCQAAAIMPKESRPSSPPRRTSVPPAPKAKPGVTPATQAPESAARQPIEHRDDDGRDYRLISALIQQLPRDGRWLKAKRDRWLLAMTSAVDLLFDVTEDHGGPVDPGADGGTHE